MLFWRFSPTDGPASDSSFGHRAKCQNCSQHCTGVLSFQASKLATPLVPVSKLQRVLHQNCQANQNLVQMSIHKLTNLRDINIISNGHHISAT